MLYSKLQFITDIRSKVVCQVALVAQRSNDMRDVMQSNEKCPPHGIFSDYIFIVSLKTLNCTLTS